MFEADPSDSEDVVYDDSNKTPISKLKKHGKPSFKFANKIKLKEKDKPEKEKIEEKEAARAKKKEKYKGQKKVKYKTKEKPVLRVTPSSEDISTPVFGVPLSVAVERAPSHDGILLPVCVRECIDYIEEHGLLYEGIYRISGVKSKVQMLKECYNKHQVAHLFEHDPSIVASLLKLFLRELPEPALTYQLMPRFEEASVIMHHSERLARLNSCVNSLPPHNKELLSWMIVHMNHVITKEKINKMSLQNVSIVLSPTMRVSHRVLNVLFMHSAELFQNVRIIRYRPPLQASVSRWSVDMPEGEDAIRDELRRQESLLNQLHNELSRQTATSEQEENLWEVQRNVTQLKRKLKLIAKTNAAKELEKQRLSSEDLHSTELHRRSVNAAELNFALQTGSLRRQSAKYVTASDTASVASAGAAESDTAAEDVASAEIKSSAPDSKANAAAISEESDSQASTAKGSSTQEGTHSSGASIETKAEENTEPCDTAAVTEGPSGMVTKSDSNESDVTLSPSSVCVSESTSQQSFRDMRPELEAPVTPVSPDVEHSTPVINTDSDNVVVAADITISTTSLDNIASTVQEDNATAISSDTLPASDPVDGSLRAELATENLEEVNTVESTQVAGNGPQQSQPNSEQAEVTAAEPTAVAVTGAEVTENEEEMLGQLISEEAQLIWEEEELIAIKDELKQKIAAEQLEIERLNEEIAEYEELRSITTLGHSSAEAISSDEYYTSTSDTDPGSDDDPLDELNSLVSKLNEIQEANDHCEAANASLVEKIDEERMGCLSIKIKIRLLQQQALGAQMQQHVQYSLI